MKRLISYYPFDETNFEAFFVKEFGTQLNTVEFEEAKHIYDAFHMLPKHLIKGLITIIEFDPSLGSSKRFYPNHGRLECNAPPKLSGQSRIEQDENGNINAIMHLNRDVFKNEPDEIKHLVLHETGHAVDHKLGIVSRMKLWLSFSEWTVDPQGIPADQRRNKNYLKHAEFERLRIQDGNMLSVSDWWFNSNASFVRWYAKRNPAEDFAESFAYYVLGEKNRFTWCEDKYKYIKEHVINHNEEIN